MPVDIHVYKLLLIIIINVEGICKLAREGAEALENSVFWQLAVKAASTDSAVTGSKMD